LHSLRVSPFVWLIPTLRLDFINLGLGGWSLHD
jgi:hypothetical protein